jgi:NADH-quinone oxidoreductase subunit A
MMTPFTSLVGYLLLFTAVAVVFLFSTLLIGKLVRPKLPNPEKDAIYECGEPTIGSSWIQFDLRFYVVALLFVIFDVEVAFFFPWAVVFGKAAHVADPSATPAAVHEPLEQLGFPAATDQAALKSTQSAAHQLVWIAFFDLLVFFGVVLVGFAYLWKRGDLDWVRSTAAEEPVGSQQSWSEPAEKTTQPAAEAATV